MDTAKPLSRQGFFDVDIIVVPVKTMPKVFITTFFPDMPSSGIFSLDTMSWRSAISGAKSKVALVAKSDVVFPLGVTSNKNFLRVMGGNYDMGAKRFLKLTW